MRYLKFIGKQKDLKPLGFEFGRYYASNYIGYRLEPVKWQTKVMIWMKGRDCDLGNNGSEISADIFDYIQSGSDKFRYVFKPNRVLKKESVYHRMAKNLITGEVVPFEMEKHDSTFLFHKYRDMDDDFISRKCEELNKIWQKVLFSQEDYDLWKGLIDKGLFETEEFNEHYGDMSEKVKV